MAANKMKLKIIIPAVEWPRFSKAKNVITYTAHIGGYVATIFKSKPETIKKHEAWRHHCKDHIEAALIAYGWNGQLYDSKGFKLTTEAFFANGSHCDTLNVHKKIEDVLVWRKGKGSQGTFFFNEDKYLAGEFKAPNYDKVNPRVEVLIERED